jgi:hypothetical protein
VLLFFFLLGWVFPFALYFLCFCRPFLLLYRYCKDIQISFAASLRVYLAWFVLLCRICLKPSQSPFPPCRFSAPAVFQRKKYLFYHALIDIICLYLLDLREKRKKRKETLPVFQISHYSRLTTYFLLYRNLTQYKRGGSGRPALSCQFQHPHSKLFIANFERKKRHRFTRSPQVFYTCPPLSLFTSLFYRSFRAVVYCRRTYIAYIWGLGFYMCVPSLQKYFNRLKPSFQLPGFFSRHDAAYDLSLYIRTYDPFVSYVPALHPVWFSRSLSSFFSRFFLSLPCLPFSLLSLSLTNSLTW